MLHAHVEHICGIPGNPADEAGSRGKEHECGGRLRFVGRRGKDGETFEMLVDSKACCGVSQLAEEGG